jgi:uncharacterized protein
MADKIALIWVLKGARVGDNAQAMAVAAQLGAQVVEKQLSFTASHLLPNWMAGARVSHLTAKARATLKPPWPDLVVTAGRRTAPVAVWIRQQSGGVTKTVHIGRPRMALSAFDVVLTTPQYGLPGADNHVQMAMPFAVPMQLERASLAACEAQWLHLPRPWILAAIGGGKFPQRLQSAELLAFAAALNRHGQSVKGSIILFDSPRSAPGAIHAVSRNLSLPHWVSAPASPARAYQAALALCDENVVTSDSISMLTEMLATQKPTHVFQLPVSVLLPRWSAQQGVMAALARLGMLHPPRDVGGFVSALVAQGAVGNLNAGILPVRLIDVAGLQREALGQIRTLLKL